MDAITIIAIIGAVILASIAVIGSIVPALPGPPLGVAALLISRFLYPDGVTASVIFWFTILTIVVTIADNFAPAWFTKWGGGSKQATRGAMIGTIAGLFILPPWGIIMGPFLGALLGEWLAADNNFSHSLKVAFFAFISFLLSTGVKLILSLWMTYYVLKACWHQISVVFS